MTPNSQRSPHALARALVDEVARCWGRGWQPADVVRATERLTSAPLGELARLVVLAEAARSTAGRAVPPLWAHQLHEIARAAHADGRDPEAVLVEWLTVDAAFRSPDHPTMRGRAARSTAETLLGALRALQPIEVLLPPPPTWPGRGPSAGAGSGAGGVPRHGSRPHSGDAAPASTPADAGLLARVRALLAKAESTTFEAEADAFMAKAQQLITRHAITDALLAGTAVPDGPGGRRIPVDDPYAREKFLLLVQVARANRCQAVFSKGLGTATVCGFASDIDSVELLFTSLLVQATSAMVAAGQRTDPDGRSRTRGFRQSFLVAYAHRIGERLQEAAASTIAQAAETERSLLPVLASREEAVATHLAQMFPRLRSMTVSARDGEGYQAGVVAADLAHLDRTGSLPRSA